MFILPKATCNHGLCFCLRNFIIVDIFAFQYGQITPALAVKVLLQFDKSINQALSSRVKSRLTFKAGKLNTYRYILKSNYPYMYIFCIKYLLSHLQFCHFINYSVTCKTCLSYLFLYNIFFFRFCDNVWTFMLNDVEFREVQEVAKVDKVKIVACDGKSEYTVCMLFSKRL